MCAHDIVGIGKAEARALVSRPRAIVGQAGVFFE